MWRDFAAISGNQLQCLSFHHSPLLTIRINAITGIKFASNANSRSIAFLFAMLYCIDMYIDHSIFVCLVAWSLNENEVGGDLSLIETSLLFLFKLILVSREQHHQQRKEGGVSIKTRSTPASLSFKGQATKQATVKWYINVLVGVGVMVLTCLCKGIGPTFFMGVAAEGLEEDFSKLP